MAGNSSNRRVCCVSPTLLEAPNWLPDGSALVVNSGGRLYCVPPLGGTLESIPSDFAVRCNNDPGQSLIYTLPVIGGTPELITSVGPSYWHGWPPDGSTLVPCGQREGTFGIFTIPAAGGEEVRLTTAQRQGEAQGLDDGPEYSPDGKSICFNSDRTGRMQIWRMEADGSNLAQITSDEYNNWFPHPSPDVRFLVFLSYAGDVAGHPANQEVTLRLLRLGEDAPSEVLARVFGGQGTINVPCWLADSRQIAFVTYQFI